MRPVDNPQPMPHPGFQLLLTSLLAHREAAREVSISSQPIVHWEPSSQPELLWDILAGRSKIVSAAELEAICVAVPSPPLSQEHVTAVALAVQSLPIPVIEQSILAMEAVLSQSQGVEPDVAQVPLEVLNALREVVPSPASRLPVQLSHSMSFQMARESGSRGSLPMDISLSPPLPGLLSAAPVHRFINLGDNLDIPIILLSDSDSVQLLSPAGAVLNTEEGCVLHKSSSLSSCEYERSSNRIATTASEGHDQAHAISITPTNSSVHSSFHSSDRVSIPDMGPIAQGGHMQDKAGREAVARLKEWGTDPIVAHIADTEITIPQPDRDLSPSLSISDDQALLDHQNMMVSRALLSTGLAVDQLIDDQLAAEANRTAICTVGELNDARLGYSHYFLREPVTLLDEACMSIESPALQRMLDVVGAVLSTGPRWSADSDKDVWTMLPPSDWFRVCTFITAAMVRGCIRTKEVWKMGNFLFEPCRDDLIHSRHLPVPATQLSALQAMLAQVQEELRIDSSLLPQDTVDGIHTTIWRAHEGLICGATLAQVNSVYTCITHMGWAALADKIIAEEPIEAITDEMREDIQQQVRGKHAGLIAKEKTHAYEAALEDACSEALKEAHATGAREAGQKGRSYENMLLARAEDEAKIKANKEFKSRLMSEHSKIALCVEAEIKEEHRAALDERRTNLAACLAEMDHEAEVEFITMHAHRLGLLNDSGIVKPTPSKQAKVEHAPRTASMARKVARSRTASVSLTHNRDRSPSGSLPHKPTPPPPIEPSPCPAAGEDDNTLHGSPAHMDWLEPHQPDLLPSIDFEVDT
jgi:hypothetical protein